jgi:hypothetical protein
METAVHRRSRALPLAAVLAVAIYGLFVAVPAESAIPAGSVVGRVTYADISGTTDLVTTIRSFEMSQELLAGEFTSTFGVPKVVHDVLPQAPLIMSGLARGLHYPTVFVVLFHPGTTTRFQQWNFAEVQFTVDSQTQFGPASATPWQTVSWSYRKVRQTTYGSNGTTQISTYCFDVEIRASC